MLAPTKPQQKIYDLEQFMQGVEAKYPNQPNFLQAVREFMEVVLPFINENPKYQGHQLPERLIEPDRMVSFRVTWTDQNGKIQVNKGYRVQFNQNIGPYKGGLRFHPTVNEDILKFLGFEQVFKNSLTTLPMGGAKGGSDFDPKGKSDIDVMRFCQAFMSELFRYIGPDRDVPAGDIGVGGREIGYLFGEYKKITQQHVGVLTGKGLSFGGSLIRPEATGYGAVYFAKEMLERRGMGFEGKKCLVSGSGNVAQYAAEKLIELGAKVLSVSDSSGTVFMPDGMTREQWEWMMELKNVRRGRIRELADAFGLMYLEGERPWGIKADYAFPCATQNEIYAEDAEVMAKNGVKMVVEGANMPVKLEAVHVFDKFGVMYAPGKASNAGGVAISGLEMTQNGLRLSWTREEVDNKLKQIMRDIHDQCVKYGASPDHSSVNYVKGANLAGFVKVADAVISQGVI